MWAVKSSSADTAFRSVAWEVPVLGKCGHYTVGHLSKSGRGSGAGCVCPAYSCCPCNRRGLAAVLRAATWGPAQLRAQV